MYTWQTIMFKISNSYKIKKNSSNWACISPREDDT